LDGIAFFGVRFGMGTAIGCWNGLMLVCLEGPLCLESLLKKPFVALLSRKNMETQHLRVRIMVRAKAGVEKWYSKMVGRA